LNRQSTPELEDFRRVQLIEVTIDSLAEVGYVGSTLAQISSRADVSPGVLGQRHWALRRSDGVVVHSAKYAAELLSAGLDARRVACR